MKRIALVAALAAFAISSAANAQSAPGACEQLRGKSYLSLAMGPFDTHTHAAGAGVLSFSARGNQGAGQTFSSLEQPIAGGAAPALLNLRATCTNGAAGAPATLAYETQASSNAVWSSAGSVSITVQNGGAAVYFASLQAGRPMTGWLLQRQP